MTISIVARCPKTGAFGVAATTGVPAVGKLLTHARPKVGAVATQARLNPYLGIDGLRFLSEGLDAARTLERLVAADPRPEVRQVGIVDRDGRTAVHTGAETLDHAGSRDGDGFSIQGNRLAGPQVLDAALAAFTAEPEAPLDRRFLEALEAASAAGGDRLGERSATIYIMAEEDYPLWDIRVDEHDEPLVELRRLHDVFSREVLPEIVRMPSREAPAGSCEEWDV